MSLPRVWCLYYDDLGANYAVLVPTYQVEEADSEWTLVSTITDFTIFRLGKAVKPRYILGIADDGSIARRLCSSVTSGRFLGFVPTFQNINSIGVLTTYTVTGKVGECATFPR